jgi:hypothetical protein
LIKNIVFIVILSTAAIVGLTYLVAPKPEVQTDKKEIALDIRYLPNQYKIIGDEKIYSKGEIFNKEENYFIVGNHESLAVLNDLYTYVKTDKNIIVVANISSLPLVLKKFAIEPTLEKFMEGKKVKMVSDSSGEIINSLAFIDQSPVSYTLYKINKGGAIQKLYRGNVKSGALDGLMSDEEKKDSLTPILEYLK